MTGTQFQTILRSIEEVRKDVSLRLDAIEDRLRAVEVDQAKASALRAARKESGMDVRWKVGIFVSAVGAIASLIVGIWQSL